MTEAPTVEGRLADLIEAGDEVCIGGYRLSAEDAAKVVAALRDRARWMGSDIISGERTIKAIEQALDIVKGQAQAGRAARRSRP